MTELRGLAAMREGKSPGAESSLLKIKVQGLQQRISTLAVEVSGHDAMPYGGPYGFSDVEVAATKNAQLSAPKYLNFRKVTSTVVLMKFKKYYSESCFRNIKMNLSYTDEQNLLRDSVSKFCSSDYDFETRMKSVDSESGHNPEHWKLLQS
ncbi:MAG: hypothetical protein CM15mP12_0700 [Gammaproteobacteria bacterium]|nr:MAG: hypothetical protein CM15mP12_0700 [Gammaproteobacteria bacterium]